MTSRARVTMSTVRALAVLMSFQWLAMADKDCVKTDQCSCTFDDGSGTVDLTSLGNSDKTPRFKDVFQKQDESYYSYNPCGTFTEGTCDGAASCMSNKELTQQTQIGNASTTDFKYDPDQDNVIAAYTAGSGVLALTEVNLICDQSACEPVFQPQSSDDPGHYVFHLTTICACPGMCSASGPSGCGGSGGIGAGSVMLIIFFTVLVIYVVAGVLFMKFVRKSSGTDLIPNKDLWMRVPGLIKDGFRCTLGVCSRKQMQYDQI